MIPDSRPLRRRPERRDLGSPHRLKLPIHSVTRFVLVRPHYPENVGAAARAMKAMGFGQLALVKPSRIAIPSHEMAQKMAVKSCDVLESALTTDTVAEAVADVSLVVATTSRRGVSGIVSPRALAARAVEWARSGEGVAVLFGNEKSGLSQTDRELATVFVRIPMVADQPSVNLAQAVQVLAYELLVAALDARSSSGEAAR